MDALLRAAAMAPLDPSTFRHATVLREEAVDLLAPVLHPGVWAVDCTTGGGGHTEGLLATGCEVLALDRDPKALDAARRRFGDEPRLHLVHADFRALAEVVHREAGGEVKGVLADLGISSPQVDDPARGFSLRGDGPLDMRMDPTRGAPLAERLAQTDEAELTRVLRDLGEERRARQVARAILRARDADQLEGTAALAEVVARAVGRSEGRIHPATRSFQALRIWVNDELGALDTLLAALPEVLSPGGRAAIISFHSLEDRRVKQAFRALSTGCVCPPDLPICACGRVAEWDVLTRRAIQSSPAEVEANPRARSARLRAVARKEAGHA